MNKKKMIELYQSASKHSNYQILPAILEEIIPSEKIYVNSRFENQRLNFLKQHLDFNEKKIVDIGGNTGFFTFEAIDLGANEVIHVEGNKEHSEFVALAAKELVLNITSENKYLGFIDSDEFPDNVDITFLFNVIHHLGDDFGDKTLNIREAKYEMSKTLNYFTNKTEYLVLQMGFCWKGDRNFLLFENGTKEELIKFVKDSIQDKWDIIAIGIAEEENGTTIYNELNSSNISRNDSLGEFRNRPIFILKKQK
jgi:SAM-dependent methyltransferase